MDLTPLFEILVRLVSAAAILPASIYLGTNRGSRRLGSERQPNRRLSGSHVIAEYRCIRNRLGE